MHLPETGNYFDDSDVSYYTDLSVSVTVRHPLIIFVVFANNKHQGSLSSVTSPPANQQPAIHKIARAVR